MKKPVDPRIAYDVTVSIGVLALTAAAWMQYGAPAGLATFGVLVVGLSIYAAERLSGR
jgi:hypothetical protein